MKQWIDRLRRERTLRPEEFRQLLTECDAELLRYINKQAQEVSLLHFGNKIYIRGLIEISNCCRNNCYYCGIRKGNPNIERYRLTQESILDCCKQGYESGFRTFVLQGGEDPVLTDDKIERIVTNIRQEYPDCAITLSLGEKSRNTYERFFKAGANRYLLRHETADVEHYAKLHPDCMSLENRKRCLFDLKEIGYQVGSGFMVGSPYQTPQNLVSDLRFLQKLQPDMIGIGPYITHEHTPFKDMASGTLEQTLRLLSILRLLFPYALLPSTTALGTIHPNGRDLGLQAGGNVVMPNLSPVGVRKKYELYANKICTGEEAAQCRGCLEARVKIAGYNIVTDRGDVRRTLDKSEGEKL